MPNLIFLNKKTCICLRFIDNKLTYLLTYIKLRPDKYNTINRRCLEIDYTNFTSTKFLLLWAGCHDILSDPFVHQFVSFLSLISGAERVSCPIKFMSTWFCLQRFWRGLCWGRSFVWWKSKFGRISWWILFWKIIVFYNLSSLLL